MQTTLNFSSLENKEVIVKFEKWVYAQFSNWYNPPPSNVNTFVCDFLTDMIREYDMPLDITFDELINDWEIQDELNEYFLD